MQERGPLGKTAVKSFGSSDSPLWIVDERLRITTLKNDYTLRLLEQYIEVDERKIKMLEKLRDNEIRLAACSNAIRSSVHKMLSLAGIRDFFEVVLSNEDVTHPKPHPEIYSTAAQRLGIPIDQCVVIEDSPVGIEAAYAAGAEEVVVVPSAKYVDEGLADFILSKNEFMRVEEFLEEASH
jgi:HAD superfamily hydrolase (TIGR01509 family)